MTLISCSETYHITRESLFYDDEISYNNDVTCRATYTGAQNAGKVYNHNIHNVLQQDSSQHQRERGHFALLEMILPPPPEVRLQR